MILRKSPARTAVTDSLTTRLGSVCPRAESTGVRATWRCPTALARQCGECLRPGGRRPSERDDAVAEFVAQSDGRLLGVAGVDLTHPVQAVRELRRAVEELGFVALRIVPWLTSRPAQQSGRRRHSA
ncbi:amidohydrolase family protein [Streptomyces bobili]